MASHGAPSVKFYFYFRSKGVKGNPYLLQEEGTDPYEVMIIALCVKEHNTPLGFYIVNYGKQKCELPVRKADSPGYCSN